MGSGAGGGTVAKESGSPGRRGEAGPGSGAGPPFRDEEFNGRELEMADASTWMAAGSSPPTGP